MRIDPNNDPYKHYLSKSRLNTFSFCKKKYYIEYILGIKSEANYNMIVGSRYHEWIDMVMKHILDYPPNLWMNFITPSYTPYERDMMEWTIKNEIERYKRTYHINPDYFVPYSTEGLYLNHEHQLRGYIDRIDLICPSMFSYMSKDVGKTICSRTMNHLIDNMSSKRKQLLICEYKTGKKSISDYYFLKNMKFELSFYKYMISGLPEFKDCDFPCACLINPQSKEIVYIDFVRDSTVEKVINEFRSCEVFEPEKCSERKYIRCGGCKTSDEAGLYKVKQEDIERELNGEIPDSWESNVYI